jgi:hypothetical protein
MDALLKVSHDDLFLEQGHLLALGFNEGWACFRIQHKEWSNLKPWSLGAVAALGSLATFNLIQTAAPSVHYLEPHDRGLIYHIFFGVTPSPARIYSQYPPHDDLGSMLAATRVVGGDVGYIDGNKSPYNGPFSLETELFTVKERYPALQAYNPLNDAMYNVMLAFDQRQYTYTAITDKVLIKEMLLGRIKVKKYTMGRAYPSPMTTPDWLKEIITRSLLQYSLDVVSGKEK